MSKKKLPNRSSFQNSQLELFRTFLCNPKEEDYLSNTIELWDAVPKYAVNRKMQAKIRSDGGMLEEITANFIHRGQSYQMTLIPARIKRQGESIDIFPSEREELIEDALRKLATKQEAGFMDKNGAGVVFSIRSLMREMKACGHGITYPDLIECLLIMNRCTIQISEKDAKTSVYAAPILIEIGAISREDWEKDPKTKWYVRFGSLVADSIRDISYRQFDYRKMMAHSSQLSRWFHKRLAHLYTQASITNPYTIRLSTIRHDSCLLDLSSFRRAAYKMKMCMDELKNAKVLLQIDEFREYGPRRTLIDILYTLTPHPEFIRQVKAANKRAKLPLYKEEINYPKFTNQM